MIEFLFPFIGGIGLFLVGMMLLSNGLVAFGGSMLKQLLARFTGTTTSAFISGMMATLMVQSSTATTVTLIGFVSAGLISFTQAIGVLIGASLGNTGTGWIVATLGLKINLGFYTMPLIGVGAMLKLMTKGRWSHLGVALAGFGVMFVGLNTLQEGMSGFASVFNLAALPVGGYGARMLIMLFGLALTAVLQSSTAAIAMILTALHTETINYDQAAALVVGAAIGTTLTGALVAIGGTIHAKRTALAYILFNLVAGIFAIMLMPVFLMAVDWLSRVAGLDAGTTGLAAFHTLFIAVGAMCFLPFIQSFAHLVERLLKDKQTLMTERLDDAMLSIPSVALEASERALERIAGHLLDIHTQLLQGTTTHLRDKSLPEALLSLEETYTFVSRIEVLTDDQAMNEIRIAQLHAIDHLLRFRARLQEFSATNTTFVSADYHWAMDDSVQMVTLAQQGLARQDLTKHIPQLESRAAHMAQLSHTMRHQMLEHRVTGANTTAQTLVQADMCRWLERTAHHIWRFSYYLSRGRGISLDSEQASEVPQMAA